MAICSSASLREHTPELAMYLFSRTSSGFAVCLGAFFFKGALPRAKLLLLAVSRPRPEAFPVPVFCALPQDFPFPFVPCVLLISLFFLQRSRISFALRLSVI